ncbi:peroxiredoxin [Breznakibacter xylanolyticus]|uniref:Peroxiredoxin n=1 Tax=Breznakibacter xylanolyticus TaxID=990 RepID=A0A2W7QFT2_9BACT|nr:TlpA disulfide reductase family protein [Breznakibacter xylanolyticus]PZX20799.1 peroxiredoxin [Breznakibacter xylanolyticus]
MRKFILGAAALMMLGACAEKGVNISGNIQGLADTKAVLNVLESGTPTPIDTVEVKGGKFKFHVDSLDAQLLIVMFEGQQAPVVFFGSEGTINVSGSKDSIDKAEIKGTELTDLFVKFNKEIPGLERQKALQNDFVQAQMTQDAAKMESLRAEAMEISQGQEKYFSEFMEANTGNAIGALLCMSFSASYDVEKLKEKITAFETSLGDHVYVGELKKILDMKEKEAAAIAALEVGNAAPDFTLKTAEGTDVALSSFKGKVVLVDFWASWCRPCREENPNVVKAYSKFKSKGFDVLSVSTDRNEEEWLKAVKEDKLTWTQVRDDSGAASILYMIRAIPSTFLLDKEGVIVARDLRGEELMNKLAELLK